MAEYLVQDTSLTAVADAIRAKTGGTDALAFPAGMVDAITGIASGGSATIYSGTFTPAENLNSIDIALEIEPKNFIFWKNSTTVGFGVRMAYGLWLIENANVISIGTNSSGSSMNSIGIRTYEEYLNQLNLPSKPPTYFTYENGILTIITTTASSSGYLVPEQYNWMAW